MIKAREILFLFVVSFLFLGLLLYMFHGISEKSDRQMTVEDINRLITEKTDLVTPNEFKILENKIEHTEEAFDSDYTISLIIEYHEQDMKHIIKQINNHRKAKKGIWNNFQNGFNFQPKNDNLYNTETFDFKVDTITNRIELISIHL